MEEEPWTRCGSDDPGNPRPGEPRAPSARPGFLRGRYALSESSLVGRPVAPPPPTPIDRSLAPAPRPAGEGTDLPPAHRSSSPADTTVTYLGHASLLFETGQNVLITDPVFAERIGRFFTKRASPSGFQPETLHGVVGVLVSHAHHDHLDYRSLERIGRAYPLIVPWGLRTALRLRGFSDVRVARVGDKIPLGAWTVTVVPARHFGGRLPFVYTSGHQGYVLEGPSCIYFAGDTGLDEPMCRDIGRRFAIDLAVLPIAGAVFPWFRRNHMNAPDALRAFRALGARRLLPIHFETFPASFEPVGTARRELIDGAVALGLRDAVTILAEGASLTLTDHPPPRVSGSVRPDLPGAGSRWASPGSP
jgi:L-ascorbate metabolism protein UlaG (beta-lactamase superfamily)